MERRVSVCKGENEGEKEGEREREGGITLKC